MKSIQSILVHLDAGPHGAPRLQLARCLGAHFGADVAALYAVTPAAVEMAIDLGAAHQALFEFDEGRRTAARDLVASVCAQPGIPIEWREAGEAPEYALIRQALYADLLVLGQRDRAQRDTGVLPDFVPSVLIASGKPALVVPYIGAPAAMFRTVLVAWKETREAARALAAAMPVLGAARAVHVVLEGSTEGEQRQLLQRYLQRRGVEARFHTLASAASEAGESILSLTADLGADLLVMGCYGHSRARELALGGASRTILDAMTVPVLMVH